MLLEVCNFSIEQFVGTKKYEKSVFFHYFHENCNFSINITERDTV